MPGDNLKKLIETFDTIEDPVLALKRTSVKRGVEGAIALAQSYGEEVNWAKIGSSPVTAQKNPLFFRFFCSFIFVHHHALSPCMFFSI
jgi:hypothetical protein